MSKFNEMLNETVRRAQQRRNTTTPFEVKDLFLTVEWDTLSRGEKQLLGKTFAQRVSEGDIPGIARCGNNKARHNQYRGI